MTTIDKGVVVFARAWDDNGQIGFGRDGSVDIERFIFIDPPVLVPDEAGDITRTTTSTSSLSKETYTFKFEKTPRSNFASY